ncbi:RICIN domain-containing protein [Granulicella arctica]|uniref:RICIN domain-containing protein n=1 Tax=Granulicella arctica TaxID=940613 RepID=UPI0021DFE800|nr:hypothetical protein [Granulicella arctica]
MIAALLLLIAMPVLHSQPLPTLAQPQGSHGLRNQQYGLFLRPREASNKDGEPIVLYPYQTWKCMAWHFEPTPEGTRLVNYFTAKSFEIQPAAPTRPLVQMPSTPTNQQAESLHFIALPDGLYEIEAPDKSGVLTAIDADGHGDLRVVIAPWKQTPAQKWQLVDIPDHFTM